ncbi:response regulator [Trichloromonas sp.]|uniref:response regulator n=1 Tax=Trichloromonas sp. TaxID=3069249 RepID=UPI003D8158D6
MREIISWLAEVEAKASQFYAQASAAFAEDQDFSAFLSNLSAEEAEHQALLLEGAGLMARQPMPEACFSFDESLRQTIEDPFVRAHALLKKDELTKEAMVEVIARAEFSEWNEIFLYVVDTLKGHDRTFQKAVAEIEKHRKDIETFISSFPWGEGILAKIGWLQPVWKRRILVVEDDPAIANLIKSLVMAEAEVVLAEDGEEGLARIREGFFDVVVSDIEMPKLNGVELYKQAVEVDPDLKGRFVFFSGSQKAEDRKFIKSAKLRILPKPSPLSVIRRVINEVAVRKMDS